jgi:hypothetical protein
MTRHTDLGWSLSRSPAISDASSMTHTSPDAAEACLPTASLTLSLSCAGTRDGVSACAATARPLSGR